MNEICEKIKMCLCKKKGEKKKKKKKNRDWIKMKVKKQFKEHLNQNESNGASCGQLFFFFFLMVAVVNFYKHTKPWNPLKTLESCRKHCIHKLREERL